MRNYFLFDGIRSTEFGAIVIDSNFMDGAERDVSVVSVPGRNGDLVIDNGRYKNLTLEVTCQIRNAPQVNIATLRAFLASRRGYRQYAEARYPDEYRRARFTGGFAIDTTDYHGSKIKLKFDTDPRHFRRDGDIKMAVADGMVITNPTYFPAKPLIRATGTGKITIGGKTLTVSAANGYTDLDCDLMESYRGAENRNAYVSGDYLEIPPGISTVKISGFTAVEITPRWYTV